MDGEDIALTHIAFFDLMGEHSVRKVFAESFFYGTQGALVTDRGKRIAVNPTGEELAIEEIV